MLHLGPITDPTLKEYARVALAEGRLSWRCTDAQGRSCNGGKSEPLEIGEWSPLIEDALMCKRGWHTTSAPWRWRGLRTWLVEGRGLVGIRQDKACWKQIRLLAEVDPQQCIDRRYLVLGRPFLSGVDLRSAKLNGADLNGADLRSAKLNGADLNGADLRYADLNGADLHSANLRNADLNGADLHSANLRNADLRYADLRSADLRYADLRYADLRYADLRNADLHSANLRNADLRYADPRNADLRNADLGA